MKTHPEQLTSVPSPRDGREDSPDELVRALIASMPPAYQQRFGVEEVREHAGIVRARGLASAHADAWTFSSDGRVGICVVADDSPGLLSLISAALMLYAFDVVAAEAYCRIAEDGRAEALDFFWVRRIASRDGPIARSEIARFSETLAALVGGILQPESILQLASAKCEANDLVSTSVRFEKDASGALGVIVVETGDRMGLLLAITGALYRQQVQITRSEVQTQEHRVIDKFYVAEIDGSAIRGARRSCIEIAVLSSIESSSVPSA